MKRAIWLTGAYLLTLCVGCGDDGASSTPADDPTMGVPSFTLNPPPIENSGTPSEWLGVDDRKQLSTLDDEDLATACDTLLAKLVVSRDPAQLARTDCALTTALGMAEGTFGGGGEPGSMMMDAAVGAPDAGTTDGGIDAGAAPPVIDLDALLQPFADIDVAQCEAEVATCVDESQDFYAAERFAAFCKPTLKACNRSASDFDGCQQALAANGGSALFPSNVTCESLSTGGLLVLAGGLGGGDPLFGPMCEPLFSQCPDLLTFLDL